MRFAYGSTIFSSNKKPSDRNNLDLVILNLYWPSSSFIRACLPHCRTFNASYNDFVLPGIFFLLKARSRSLGFSYLDVEPRCCVFWPVNGCFTRRSLVKIIIFSVFTFFRASLWALRCGDLPPGLGAQTRPFNLCARKPWRGTFASCWLCV